MCLCKYVLLAWCLSISAHMLCNIFNTAIDHAALQRRGLLCVLHACQVAYPTMSLCECATMVWCPCTNIYFQIYAMLPLLQYHSAHPQLWLSLMHCCTSCITGYAYYKRLPRRTKCMQCRKRQAVLLQERDEPPPCRLVWRRHKQFYSCYLTISSGATGVCERNQISASATAWSCMSLTPHGKHQYMHNIIAKQHMRAFRSNRS